VALRATSKMGRTQLEVPLQGTFLLAALPRAALRLPWAMVHPARWAGGAGLMPPPRTMMSRPVGPEGRG
jgi:hypothetical protein